MQAAKARTPRRPSWGKLLAGALVLAALAAAWRYTPLSDYLTLRNLRNWAHVLRTTPWAPFAVAAAYTPAALLLFPRPVVTLLAVISFGAWIGFACAATGIVTAALVTYTAGRWLPYERIQRLCGKHIDAARDLLREHGIISIFALNMIPVPPFAVQGLMAGSMRMSVWQYAVGTLLSVVPGLLAATVFGHELSSMLEENGSARWWVLVATLVVFAGFGYAMKRWAGHRLHRTSSSAR
jgi:phospholipase D1/2